MTICQGCGAPMRTQPAGFSKTTGKPYSAFQTCSARCGFKPQIGAPAPTPAPSYNVPQNAQTPRYAQNIAKNDTPSVDWDKKSWGMCKHAFLVEAFKLTMKDNIQPGVSTSTIIESVAEEWADMSMRGYKGLKPQTNNVDMPPYDDGMPNF